MKPAFEPWQSGTKYYAFTTFKGLSFCHLRFDYHSWASPLSSCLALVGYWLCLAFFTCKRVISHCFPQDRLEEFNEMILSGQSGLWFSNNLTSKPQWLKTTKILFFSLCLVPNSVCRASAPHGNSWIQVNGRSNSWSVICPVVEEETAGELHIVTYVSAIGQKWSHDFA